MLVISLVISLVSLIIHNCLLSLFSSSNQAKIKDGTCFFLPTPPNSIILERPRDGIKPYLSQKKQSARTSLVWAENEVVTRQHTVVLASYEYLNE